MNWGHVAGLAPAGVLLKRGSRAGRRAAHAQLPRFLPGCDFWGFWDSHPAKRSNCHKGRSPDLANEMQNTQLNLNFR